jgi:hypothetical protein
MRIVPDSLNAGIAIHTRSHDKPDCCVAPIFTTYRHLRR